MPAKFVPTRKEMKKLRHLIEEEKMQQWKAAARMEGTWTPRRVERMIKQHGLHTQRTGPRSGAGHPGWKGGKTKDRDGYVLVYSPDHPHKNSGGYVREHRLVMEKHLGRYLDSGEVVHHKNGRRDDNRIENLELFQSNGKHLKKELAGHCPNWSPQGEKHILATLEKNRQRTGPYGSKLRGKIPHSRAEISRDRRSRG